MRILTICPSIYPKKLINMMDSYLSTRSECNSIRVSYENNGGNITKIFNDIFTRYHDYDYYHMSNDDVLYKTQDWDLKLARKGKITYGNDLIQGKNLCTFPMIDGDIVRALGWLQMPTLHRYAGDCVWKVIGEHLGILEYVEDVVIEHKWEGADAEINQKDMTSFAQWLPWAFRDIKRVREALDVNGTK